MADYRLKLSDGTTTINLYEGFAKVLQGGLQMPPPTPRPEFTYNPFINGGRYSSFHYENRTIQLRLKIFGTDQDDLKTNIRSIHRLLTDASARALSGYGDGVYLEYQWGDTADQSTLFDVLRGDLVLPDDYLSAPLYGSHHIINASLVLTCKPFGRYANQTIATADINNTQSLYSMGRAYVSNDDTQHNVDGNNWEGMTFETPAAGFTADGAMIKCYRAGTITDLTLEIFATAAGVPTGAALATGTVDVSALEIIGSTYTGWMRVIFDTPVALSGSTVYALVAYIGEANPNILYWRVDTAAGYILTGQRVWSNDGGTSWNADATDDMMFAVLQSDDEVNYQDITTSESYGDMPAKMYLKVKSLTTNHITWIAKRSGARQTDDLWTEGDEIDSFTDIVGAPHYVYGRLFPNAYCSNYSCYDSLVVPIGGNISGDPLNDLARINYIIPTVPRGQFKVLARVLVDTQDPNDYDHISFAMGWSYGDKTYEPTDVYKVDADNTWQTVDLGLLNLPPIAESDIATNNTLELRLYMFASDTLTQNEEYHLSVDYIFLLPVDEGVVIASTTTFGTRIVIDGITDPPNVYLVNASDVVIDYPNYVGAPFNLGRESTRIYVIQDFSTTAAFESDIIYQPQFLVI